ncbi:MAG: AAA family ATPase [Anaerolineae bacterium]|nr:AAA family ATPase [Anaerolineae bacterium]
MQIILLGRFALRRGERTLPAKQWTRRKSAALLQRLALEKRLLRDEALEFLWPGSEPAAAANNFYRTLYRVRQKLDETLGPGASERTFTFKDGVLRLGEDVWVDVHAFEARCRQSVSTAQLQEALALYKGPLLPANRYDDWTALPRQNLHRLYRDTSLRLAQEATDPREIEAAVARLRPFLEEDPADEVIHRQLMRLFALLGRRHDALRQYQECVAALDEHLGVPPMPETRELHQQLLGGEVDEVEAGSSPPLARPRAPAAPVAAEVRTQTPLVGRDEEFERLRTLLQAAAAGQGKTVLVAGPTGVGKTRLAAEMMRLASSIDMTVLSGAAYEYEGHLAYQPFAEALDRWLAEHGDRQATNPLTEFRPLDGGDPQREKWALFNHTGSFLAGLAADAPVLFFLDDLHAADEASLQLFHYLARHTRSRPFLLLATYRTDLVHDPASPFSALLNSLYREGLRETITLQPLPAGAIGALVRHIQGGAVDENLLRRIVAATEGNPFFAEEICSALLASGSMVQEEGTWHLKSGSLSAVPSDLRQLLRQRIRQSGAAVASLLEIAAVIGRTFQLEILSRVSILAEADLIDAIDGALHANFIESRDGAYQFRHELIRRALYQAQSEPRLKRLHARVAAALEAEFAGDGDRRSMPVEALAYHYEHSDLPQRALPYLLEAGERAAEVYAFEEAIHDHERALALMDEHHVDDRQLRWQLLESLGWWEKILANTPRAVARFDQALSLSPGGRWQPQPNERARAHAGAAMALLTAGDTAAAEAHLDAAQEQIDPEAHASEYADILYNVAQLRWHRNEYHEAFAAAERSLEIAEQLDDTNAVARAFEMLALACHSLGEWQLGLEFEDKRSAIAGPELDVSDAFDVHL